MIKICQLCKINFISELSYQKYCSKNCYNISKQNCVKKYQEEHKIELKQYKHNYMKKYRKLHREAQKQYRNKHRNLKSQIDISFKIEHNLRNRIWYALKGTIKSAHTIELLGCSIEFLKQHLESKFKVGMSWLNYGVHGWHVDHIIPCDAFDLSDVEQQKQCFHFTNLQPLWANENIRKKNKIIMES